MLEMFPNPKSLECTKKINTELGYPWARMRFEYYEILVTRNIVLPKHIYQKNDHMKGYKLCVVYSFYLCLNVLEYKVSIIMTNRSAIGNALEDNNQITVKSS